MKKLLALALALMLVLSVGASAFAGAGDNSIVYNITSEPPQMWHNKSTDTTSFQLFRHLFTGLLSADQNDQPIPGVADMPEISEDGKTYTFKLRQDATWWDGKPVTAKDFEYSWLALLNPEYACQYAEMAFVIKNAGPYFKGEATRDELGIKVLDDYTFQVELEYPLAYFNSLMSFGVFMPLRQDYIEQYGDAYGTDADKIMGNGPYKVESWAHESEFVMVKNASYFNADAYKIDRLVGKMINDSNTAYSMFETGELDMVGLSGTQLPLAEQAGYEILQYGDGATFYLQFNCNEGTPTSNLNIRRALGLAIDRDSFVKYILRNHCLPALTYTTPEIKGFGGTEPFGSFVKIDYVDKDIEKAKEHWAKGCEELGMTSEEVAAQLTLIADDSDTAKEVSAAYQEYWRTGLGIEVVVENMPFKSRLERTTNREYSVVSGGWGPDYNDPLTFLEIMTTGNGNNTGDWSNAEYDALIAGSRTEVDPQKRMEMLYKAEEIL
ncbi:MAG: peptide ABC transporter substrate-binding protein, partial [Clostridiales bacterium]|nr:peptide ABC transporter substrate-binding protein [Clostridiales bacterium]